MITFQEHKDPGYAGRTKENASAHATIAIASDFFSGGEKLTKRLVLEQDRIYIPIDISTQLDLSQQTMERVIESLNSANKGNILDNEITLNIAGNGIYTLRGKYSQLVLDNYVYFIIGCIINSPLLKVKIAQIRTGGQTGLDEAGAKAGARHGIDTLVLCPRGWKFRDINGTDIADETEFKKRFL